MSIDLEGIQEHPVRVAIGLLCIVLGIGLLLYRIFGRAVSEGRRRRSYGENRPVGTGITSHKRGNTGKKRYKVASFSFSVPHYKGRKKTEASPTLTGAKSTQYHGKSRGSGAVVQFAQQESYKEPKRKKGASRIGGLPLPMPHYTGGKSAASSAALPTIQTARYHGKSKRDGAAVSIAAPERHTEPKGNARAYGSGGLPVSLPHYTGGKHAASAAVFSTAKQEQYRGEKREAAAPIHFAEPKGYCEPKRKGDRYGAFQLPSLPLPYFGRRKKQEAAPLLASQPEVHRGKKRITQAVTFQPQLPERYRGGGSAASGISISVPLPMSHSEPQGDQKRYGRGEAVGKQPSVYYGTKKRTTATVPLPAMPASHKEPQGDLRRYGAGDSLERMARPEPPHYTGGSTTSAKEPWVNPETGKLAQPLVSNAKQYGNARYGGKLYGRRVVRYREEEPLDSSTVLRDDPIVDTTESQESQ
jgi:hypothetical protein